MKMLVSLFGLAVLAGTSYGQGCIPNNCDAFTNGVLDPQKARLYLEVVVRSSYSEDAETYTCPPGNPNCGSLADLYPSTLLMRYTASGFTRHAGSFESVQTNGPQSFDITNLAFGAYSLATDLGLGIGGGISQLVPANFSTYPIERCALVRPEFPFLTTTVTRNVFFGPSGVPSCDLNNINAFARAGGSIGAWRETETRERNGISGQSNSRSVGFFAATELIFADNLPATENPCLMFNARITEDNTSCNGRAAFPHDYIYGGAIVTTAGGYSRVERFTVCGAEVDPGNLAVVPQSESEAGFAWTLSVPLSEAASSTNRISSGFEVKTFAFNVEMLDYAPPHDGRFTQADVDYLSSVVAATPSLATSPEWLKRANIVPAERTSIFPSTLDPNDIVDAADVAFLQAIINAGFSTPVLGDRNGDGIVNCGDWLAPGDWVNPATSSGWRLGESGFVEALDLDRDGILSLTGPSSDRFTHYRLLNRADYNGDGYVDDDDFVIFQAFYNDLAVGGDLNCDLVTDDADFSIFAVAYDTLLCSDIGPCTP
ncbi:MAG: hypothetical protein K2Y21_03455 [Phycisphaerales bacterium]|nr:hypothetical protein [Phycisphaerales bacterium]